MKCPYASLLGKPKEGVHEPRLLTMARNDLVGTVMLAGVTSYATNIHVVKTFVGWFVLGEVMHYAFGVQTTFLDLINMRPTCDDTEKE